MATGSESMLHSLI